MIADSYGTHIAFVYGGAVVLLGTLILALTKLPSTASQLMR